PLPPTSLCAVGPRFGVQRSPLQGGSLITRFKDKTRIAQTEVVLELVAGHPDLLDGVSRRRKQEVWDF
ncbi:MAG TPA: hypothetical protein VHI52_17220, partial [Verrucomicrobiae bacterium]|nr:hypothetical protein [Verrucomicrobiae bacterium]